MDLPCIKIIIADDHHLFADGVEQILNSVENYQVVGKADNGKMLMTLLNGAQVDLILLDINMPQMDGMASAIEIKRRLPAMKILFLSMYSNATIVAFARRNNINGFLLKSTTAAELKEAIADILAGRNRYMNLSPEMPPDNAGGADEFGQKSKLSPREIDVIRLIRKGRTTKEIAETLVLSIFTIETHRKNIFRKLDIKNVAELVAFASRLDL
jgi:DNA-binding NarL/FixJ family response regulator